jgi:hypothetical protein
MTTKAMNKKLKCFNDFGGFKRLDLALNPKSSEMKTNFLRKRKKKLFGNE